ncbi:reverse transcriptase, partial [Phytophthora megakarya]
MYDNDPKSRAMDLPVCPEENIHLRPGQDAIVRIWYGQPNPRRELVWAGRGKNWDSPVVRIVEYGQFPGQPGFVRPGKARYEEWQQLIHECTVSRQARMRAERLEQILREREPPCTQTQRYQWPTKLLMRPQSQVTEVKMVKLQEKPKPLDMTLKIIRNSAVVMNTVAIGPEEPETRPEPVEQTHPDSSPEVETLNPESMTDVENDAQVPEPSVDAQSQASCSTPVQRLEAEYARVMRVSAEELDLEPAVYLREGSDLMAQLRDHLIMLPEVEELTPECNIDEANIEVMKQTTPEMEAKMRRILKRHRSIFLGDGNVAPAPARGVVKTSGVTSETDCHPFLVKVFELLKKLLEAELIEHSEYEWSSPIVIVLKKNGIDIRMCIDYRLLNLLIKLYRYPLPLIDDLLVDFRSAMWFMSLDMASGFWAVRMTERAKLISAFVCPFGHFQWLRMPFGLKNAPLIYQSIINNGLWGFVRLPPEEEALVDQEVLEFLNLEPQEVLKPEVDMWYSEIPALDMTVFRRNIPSPSQMGPVLGR